MSDWDVLLRFLSNSLCAAQVLGGCASPRAGHTGTVTALSTSADGTCSDLYLLSLDNNFEGPPGSGGSY